MVAVLLVLLSFRSRQGSGGLVAVDRKSSNRTATHEPSVSQLIPQKTRTLWQTAACSSVTVRNLLCKLANHRAAFFRSLRFQATVASSCSQTSSENKRISRVRERRCPLIPLSEVRSTNKMLRSQNGKRLAARSSVATATEGA